MLDFDHYFTIGSTQTLCEWYMLADWDAAIGFLERFSANDRQSCVEKGVIIYLASQRVQMFLDYK
jgi:hypothetical protein